MTDPFELEARYYDRIWGAMSDYEKEVDFMDSLLKKYKLHRILDLACGTGGHVVEFAERGYEVVGLDISKAMLTQARKKALHPGSRFVLGDMTRASEALNRFRIPLTFDAVTCMGNSIAHMTNDSMLDRLFRQVCRSLRAGGLFFFWGMNAELPSKGRTQQLLLNTILNSPKTHLALLSYNTRNKKKKDVTAWHSLWLIKKDGRFELQTRKQHLRLFMLRHVRRMLETNGFMILATFGDTLGKEYFERKKHSTIFVVCQKRAHI